MLDKKPLIDEETHLMMIQIGIIVYAIRNTYPMTKTLLSKLSHISNYLINRIEHGQSNFNMLKFGRIIKTFGFGYSDFYSLQGSKIESEKVLRKFQETCFINQEKIDFLLRYWSDNPPMEEKDPILKLF